MLNKITTLTATDLVAVAAALLCVGCSAAPSAASEAKAQADVVDLPYAHGTQVTRVHDRGTGVICYVSDGYKSGGISCIPSSRLPIR